MLDYKLSSYIVSTNELDTNQIIIFSTMSGKKMILSDYLWQCLLNGNFTELPQETLDKLLESKILLNKGIDERLMILEENKGECSRQDFLYEVIQPSAYCQMGCYYCGQSHEKKNVSNNDIINIVENIKKKVVNSTYKKLMIGWFGAEPLIGINQMRDITIQLKKLCVEYHLTYDSKVVTNGLSLNEKVFLELVNKLSVSKVEITLDGVGDKHDNHRFLKNGKSTYKKVYNNLKNIIDLKDKNGLKCEITVRCNVDNNNEDGVYDLINNLYDDGILNRIGFYPIGIYEWGDKINPEKLSKREFALKELEWKSYLLSKQYNVYSGLIPKRKKIVCLYTKKDSEVYDSYGNTFSCTEVPYTKDYNESIFSLGSFSSENKIDKSASFDWNDYINNNKTLPCYSCEMLPICGGGCPKQWLDGNLPCPTFKFNYAERLKIYSILTKHGYSDESLSKIDRVITESKVKL